MVTSFFDCYGFDHNSAYLTRSHGYSLHFFLLCKPGQEILSAVELVAVGHDVPEGVGPGQLLPLLLLTPSVHPNILPGHLLGPPGRLGALLAPARLAAARAVLQHEGDEGPQLGLGHLLHRSRNPIDHYRRKLVQVRVLDIGCGGLLRQGCLQLAHDDSLEVPDHILQRFGAERPEVVGCLLTRRGHQHYRLLADPHRELVNDGLELPQESRLLSLPDGRIRLEGVTFSLPLGGCNRRCCRYTHRPCNIKTYYQRSKFEMPNLSRDKGRAFLKMTTKL